MRTIYEINNYHLLQYKLLRISLDGSSYGKTLESMNWVKYSQYNDEIKNVERKCDFIKKR